MVMDPSRSFWRWREVSCPDVLLSVLALVGARRWVPALLGFLHGGSVVLGFLHGGSVVVSAAVAVPAICCPSMMAVGSGAVASGGASLVSGSVKIVAAAATVGVVVSRWRWWPGGPCRGWGAGAAAKRKEDQRR